ncbi:MAG: sigma-70 family RNA polymerase sigma factor [Planctomycetota bacterium]
MFHSDRPPARRAAAGEDTQGLLARLQRGDEEAAGCLFELHRERLRRAIRLRLPPRLRSQVDEDDLCQTTVLKALRKIRDFEYRGQGTFLAWLVRIAERSIRDSLRREQRQVPLAAPRGGGGLTAESSAEDPDLSPSRRAIHREELDLLERGMDSLNDAERDLLIDREILGVDLDSLADRLGKSREAVRLMVYRAKNRLARWFERNA